MPKRRNESKKDAAASGKGRISAQPDDVLLQVLSLLPSEEVVRTCVLSRRWRQLWESTPTVRIARDGVRPWSVKWLDTFLRRLMLLRDNTSPLDDCEISCRPFLPDDTIILVCWQQWIRDAIGLCQTRVLKFCMSTHPENYLAYVSERLFSQHLTRLHLTNVGLSFSAVHLSSCPALEDLELNWCNISAKMILSPSLKRLSMTCCSFSHIPHTTISAPSLTSLKLDCLEEFFPLFESMPSLVTTFVRLGDRLDDTRDYGSCGDDYCLRCHGNDDDDGYECALLQSLSSSVNLELIIQPEVIVFTNEFKCPTTFTKLKTLLLSDWRVEADFSPLIYFLRHSPIIEKLTLQLLKTKDFVVEADSYSKPMGKFLVSKHLKMVDVRYHDDQVLHKVLKILSTHGVPPETICIQKINS